MNSAQVGPKVIGTRPKLDFCVALAVMADIARAADDIWVDAFQVPIEIVWRAEPFACSSTVWDSTEMRLCVSLFVLAVSQSQYGYKVSSRVIWAAILTSARIWS